MKKLIFLVSFLINFFVFTNIVYALCDVNISESMLPYTINQNNTYYCLNESSYIGGQNAITFINPTENTTLDCLGYNIDSNDTSDTSGVTLNGANIINNTIKNCNISDFNHGIYLPYSHNSTVADNIFISNTEGIHLCTNTHDNLITRNNVTGGSQGIYIHNNANSNNFTYNNINSVDPCGIRLIGNSSNNLFANSSVSNSGLYDYCLLDTTTTNKFINMNWTEARKIYFYNSTTWFNYNNATDGIWLKTNVSADQTILTRELINWNQSLIQWNDTNTSGVTTRYNITGLLVNTSYKIYNNSVLAYTLQTDSSGVLSSFTIYLNDEHEIKVQEGEAPSYSNNSTNNTVVGLPTEFRLRWIDNVGLSGYIFSFDNCRDSFVNDTWTSFTSNWSNVTKTINNTVGCTVRWKVYANDTYYNWNVSEEYSYVTTTLPDDSSCTANIQCSGGYCVHGICRSTSTYCGDAYCDAGESCFSCVSDCGICPGGGETPSPPTEGFQPPQEPTEFPETVIELPDLPPLGTPITMPETGLAIKLEPNFMLTLYPLTNLTAVVHNVTKIEEPSKYKILLCNQTLISS